MKHFIFHYMEYDNGQTIRDGFEYYSTPEDVTIETVNVDKLTTFVKTNVLKDPCAAIAILKIRSIDEDHYNDKMETT